MLKRIANLLEDNTLLLAIALTILISYLSFIPLKIPKVTFGYFDKLTHVLAYTALGFSWFLNYRKKVAKFKIVAIALFIYGIIIEVIQGNCTANREADTFDVLANTLGIFIGYVVVILWIRNRKE